MFYLVKKLNGGGDRENSAFGNQWAQSISNMLFEHEAANNINEAIKRGDFDMSTYGKVGTIPSQELRATAQFEKARHLRKVNREVYYTKMTGFDSHGSIALLGKGLEEGNAALAQFVTQILKRMDFGTTVLL